MSKYIFFSAEPLSFISLPETDEGYCHICVGDNWSKMFLYSKLSTLIDALKEWEIGDIKLGNVRFTGTSRDEPENKTYKLKIAENLFLPAVEVSKLITAYEGWSCGSEVILGTLWPEKITSLSPENVIGAPSAMSSKIKVFGTIARMKSGWHFRLQLWDNVFLLHGNLGETKTLEELKTFIGTFVNSERKDEPQLWTQRLGSTFVTAVRGPKSWPHSEYDMHYDCVTMSHGYGDMVGRVVLSLPELEKVYEHIDSHIDFIMESKES